MNLPMENMDEDGVPYRVNQHVFVDEQQETETILFKDDEYGHMQTVVFVDHKKVLTRPHFWCASPPPNIN